MKRYILDTNLLVRFLKNDHPKMSSAAADLFLQSASGKVELHLDPTIVAETAFVLTSFYKQDRAEVADALRDGTGHAGRVGAVQVPPGRLSRRLGGGDRGPPRCRNRFVRPGLRPLQGRETVPTRWSLTNPKVLC
jgi:hypothetical protein